MPAGVRLCIAAAAGPGQPVIVPVLKGAVPAQWAEAAATDGFTGEAGTVCDIFAPTGQIVLTGLGASGDPLAAEAAGAWGVSRLLRIRRIAIDATSLSAKSAAAVGAGAYLRAWRFARLQTRIADDGVRLADIDLVSPDPALPGLWAMISAAMEGTTLARDLVTEPANVLTPECFLERLEPLIEAGVTLEVVQADDLARLGFGGLVAVGQGSAHPPCLAILRWAGTQAGPPVAFVGKGITFDTGGISIKPADGMWDMRSDMAGAAACAGAMLALALRRSPTPVIAVLPLAENTTGAASYRPGDVLRLFDGSTVQVVDTDAEGRLVLADALAYAVSQSPRAVIDLATLTGSIVTALGYEMAGAYGNDLNLQKAAQSAGAAVGENIWGMPIAESHRRALDSDIADIKHCVDERFQPDASHAAAFLREFVGETSWLHLDIAAMESKSEADGRHAKGATGFGVRLLDRLIADRFEVGHG